MAGKLAPVVWLDIDEGVFDPACVEPDEVLVSLLRTSVTKECQDVVLSGYLDEDEGYVVKIHDTGDRLVKEIADRIDCLPCDEYPTQLLRRYRKGIVVMAWVGDVLAFALIRPRY